MCVKISTELLSLLEQAVMARQGTRCGDEIKFRCPLDGHEDIHPSARYNPVKGVWFCPVCDTGAGACDLARRLNIGDVSKAPISSSGQNDIPPGIWLSFRGKKLVKYWPYHSAEGTVLGYAARYEDSKEKNVLPFFKRENGEWKCKGPRPPSPLYGLEVLASKPNAVVWIVEGEKSAECIQGRGGVAVTSQGGSTQALKADWSPIKGREVIIWRDNDKPGEKYHDDVVSKLRQPAFSPASIRSVRVEDLSLPTKGDVVDWLKQNPKSGLDDLLKLPMERLELTSKSQTQQEAKREAQAAKDYPNRICLSGEIPCILYVDKAAEIITRSNSLRIAEIARSYDGNLDTQTPLIFRHQGSIVRLVLENGVARLERLGQDEMNGLLLRDVEFGFYIKLDEKGDVFHHRTPQGYIVRDLLSYPPAAFPALNTITTVPFFGSDGSLVESNGYYAPDGVMLLRCNHLRGMPGVPDNPSIDQIEQATDLILSDLLVDFPFVSEADRAHAVAALLVPFVRRLVDGCTPLHLIDASTPGSGKSLLADTIAHIVTGSSVPMRSFPTRDEEVRKTITSDLTNGSQVIILDNLPEKRRVDSAPLAAVLTTRQWGDRLLGQTKIVSATNDLLWIATGNNVSLSFEIARRTIRIRIDPCLEHPEEREGFRHHPLLQWVQAHHVDLVHSLLTLCRAWIAAGRPKGDKKLGSFEAWSEVVGGILDVAGISGFLANQREMYDFVDEDRGNWTQFFAKWYEELQGSPQTPSDLGILCQNYHLLLQVRGEGGDVSQVTLLGKALKNQVGRVYCGLRLVLEKDGGRHKGRMYRLEKVADDPSCGIDHFHNDFDYGSSFAGAENESWI